MPWDVDCWANSAVSLISVPLVAQHDCGLLDVKIAHHQKHAKELPSGTQVGDKGMDHPFGRESVWQLPSTPSQIKQGPSQHNKGSLAF